MKLSELLTDMRRQLVSAKIVDAANETRDLLQAALRIERSDLLRDSAVFVDVPAQQKAQQLVNRRLAGEPVDRIVGWREFRGRIFHLNEATLSPREDTEAVIELAHELLVDKKRDWSILDLGIGTGCILLSLLKELPNATGFGVDLAREAMMMGVYNAEKLGLDDRARFTVSNWFQHVTGKFDLIISNPPYIKTDILSKLEREVRDYDPRLALDGGKDGLECYHIIAKGAKSALNKAGHVIVEIGQGQADQVNYIFGENGFTLVSTRVDGGNIQRALAFKMS